MYIYYYEEPEPRSAAVEIWLRCGRRALTALAVAAWGTVAVYLAPALAAVLG